MQRFHALKIGRRFVSLVAQVMHPLAAAALNCFARHAFLSCVLPTHFLLQTQEHRREKFFLLDDVPAIARSALLLLLR